jgi:K+-sensing histidine kinase KdpD
LRGSATSISEYARFLLTESLGVLDTVQRKILLRIQRDAERVNNLIVELINAISKASGVLDRANQGVLFSEVIDQAVAGSEPLYREKEILLSLDIQDDLPVMYVERDLLQTVINTFLQHGAFMIPYAGQARLRLTPTSEDKGREFIALHLADESLLSKEVLPDFLTTPGGDPMLDSGLGEDRWTVLETLVDELQGRVWMETETGRPVSINLALPVVQSTEAAKFDVRDG